MNRNQAVASQHEAAPTKPTLDDSRVRGLAKLLAEVGRAAIRHPDLNLELYAIDERCQVSEGSRRQALSMFHAEMWEDNDGRWYCSPGETSWCRYWGDVGGIAEFERLTHSLAMMLQPAEISPVVLMLFLGVHRPGLLREAEISSLPFVIDLSNGPDKRLVTFWQASLRQPAFVSLQSTVDWLLSPAKACSYPVNRGDDVPPLPGWDLADGFVRGMVGLPPKDTDKPRLEIGKFFVKYRGKRCDLPGRMPYDVLERLSRRPGQYFEYAVLKEDVWQDSMTEDETVQRAVSSLRKALHKSGVEGITIDGRQRGHYRLLLM